LRFDGVVPNVAKGAKPEADEHSHEVPLSADSGHSRDREGTAGFGPLLTSIDANSVHLP